ncbi:STM4013/SEN3800 family hydrolase [Streptomycetaceae bacterium NBC_01309]
MSTFGETVAGKTRHTVVSCAAIDANRVVGHRNILLITLDSLRYDVARAALATSRTPNLARLLPSSGWEPRHAPGTFTWPAHHAIFAGFLPKPAAPGSSADRLFKCRPTEGKAISPGTYVVEGSNLVRGLTDVGYRSVCIGGVDYFSSRTPLGSVFPAMFQHAYWRPEFNSTEPDSTRHQVRSALDVLADPPESVVPGNENPLTFLFMNISATHVPHAHYLPESRRNAHGATDGWDSQLAALAYADQHLGTLLDSLPAYGPWLVIACADHGDAFGDDGYLGHGIGHPSVLTVPYTQALLDPA